MLFVYFNSYKRIIDTLHLNPTVIVINVAKKILLLLTIIIQYTTTSLYIFILFKYSVFILNKICNLFCLFRSKWVYSCQQKRSMHSQFSNRQANTMFCSLSRLGMYLVHTKKIIGESSRTFLNNFQMISILRYYYFPQKLGNFF